MDYCNRLPRPSGQNVKFNTPILFHQDATDTCLKAATLAYSNAQAIRITKGTKSGFHIDTAFGIEYYDTTSCGSSSLISNFQCPAHCTTYDKKEYVPTSVSCMTVALIVADDSQPENLCSGTAP